MAQELREEGCFAKTYERKYYHRHGTFIKRTLRPREFRTGHLGLHIPRVNKERLRNEAESLRFIRQHTNIPVPTVYCDFEDDEAYYLIEEYVDGASMSDLSEDEKKLRLELKTHLTTLKTLKSNRIGGPTGLVIPPYRVMRRTDEDAWALRPSNSDEYVFCHNDLSQQNVVVDPLTLKIQAIVDWEYAGFFPSCFQWPFYNRLGPSSALEGETDDSFELLDFLQSQVEAGQVLDQIDRQKTRDPLAIG
ncbi:kinase-like domain-containing protein [Pseudomassariella vexata]|uniref:Kinase-like domain-containing protein n=1 Tax=Pseudomassariella vexata TaxID=1141098 RepID=A0A1Y2DHD8_9PEZI|nr:kinase-like domain-containing protein [Pseudomassariella vexata]ORY58514.1 kinase-like domain-containing protein [Pseudomassariella vexata]